MRCRNRRRRWGGLRSGQRARGAAVRSPRGSRRSRWRRAPFLEELEAQTRGVGAPEATQQARGGRAGGGGLPPPTPCGR